MVTTFKGTPAEIGRAYGEKFKEKILKNIAVLIDPHRESLKSRPGFEAWKKRHEANIAAEFPWYIGEMAALAEAVGVDYDTILMLNLRAWQYDLYSGLPLEDCSSFILRRRGGADVNAGALDIPMSCIAARCGLCPTMDTPSSPSRSPAPAGATAA